MTDDFDPAKGLPISPPLPTTRTCPRCDGFGRLSVEEAKRLTALEKAKQIIRAEARDVPVFTCLLCNGSGKVPL